MLRNNAVARRCSYVELGLPVALACCDTVRTKSTFETFFERFLGKFNGRSFSCYMQLSVKNNIYYKMDL